jgi:hypothetical protein
MKLRITLLCACSLAVPALSQPVVAPTNEPVDTARGQDIGGYNVVNSFETGYRFRDVGGNLGKYRSDVNFGNGVRLLGTNLTVHSREGQGRYFDELLLNTQGLGNDPYQSSSFRVRKNRLYSYDLLWRRNEYFNPALPLASGQHFQDTARTLQDHNLVLLPQSPFRLFAGFSRMAQSGGGLSTVNLLGATGDEFPLFANIRRLQNEFRLGFEAVFFGTRLSVIRGWEGFRDDTRREAGASQGNNLADEATLRAFRRDEPYHGSTRNWRVGLLHDQSKRFGVNGRFTYAGTRRNFLFDEAATGTSRFGAPANRQILVAGEGRRPVTTAALTLSLFPTDRITIANHSAFHSTRMDGDGVYRELDNATLLFSTVEFSYLGIRAFTNATDVNVRFGRTAGLFAGYQFSTRRIRSVEQQSFEGTPERGTAEQTNRLHAGRFGLRLQPAKALSLVFDAEIGRADRPVFTTSERNYHALAARIRYKTRNLLLSAYTRANYNFNSASLFSHSSRSRQYAADLSWTVLPWLSFDANYSKLHLDTLTGIAYFFNRQLTDDRSVYISNLHGGHAGVRIGIGARADLFVGYSRIQDTGDGSRTLAAPWVIGAPTAALAPGTLAYQTYPVAFESPLARLSVRLHNRLRWNAGYQHYRYAEDLLPMQNYRAHTGFTSLSWSF